MSALKLKICGMREPENIRQVAALHPDYMGFIFYEKSPRYVGQDFQVPDLPQNIMKVGVFVNEQQDLLIKKSTDNNLDLIQLHGDESVDYCRRLKEKGFRIIKVFRVDDAFDFSVTVDFESVAEYFLFDTKGKLYGGNAVPFNWDLLNNYNQKTPFFLSGGLQVSNLERIKKLNRLNLHALDMNSGVEDYPGIKNTGKIKEIINQLSV